MTNVEHVKFLKSVNPLVITKSFNMFYFLTLKVIKKPSSGTQLNDFIAKQFCSEAAVYPTKNVARKIQQRAQEKTSF